MLTVQILYCKNVVGLQRTQRISRKAVFVGNSLQNNNINFKNMMIKFIPLSTVCGGVNKIFEQKRLQVF